MNQSKIWGAHSQSRSLRRSKPSQAVHTYAPPPPPLVSLDLIETFKNTCSIPLFPSSSPPPHLAPDAPRGVEIGEDVLVVLDVGGKALGVDGHGVLPVLVQRLEVFFFGGGALFFGREGERGEGGGALLSARGGCMMAFLFVVCHDNPTQHSTETRKHQTARSALPPPLPIHTHTHIL